MAYSIVSIYGMNPVIGNISFYDSKQSEYSFQKPYSEATAEKIDNEVKRLIDDAYDRTKQLLTKHRQHLDLIAKELLEKEILFQADLERLIGKRPFEKLTTYQQFTNGSGKYEKKQHENEQPGVDPTPTLEGDRPNDLAK
jgi:cell division protease FtsH